MAEYVNKDKVEDIILNCATKIDMLKQLRKLPTITPMPDYIEDDVSAMFKAPRVVRGNWP